MALSKLNFPLFFFSPQTLIPSQKSQPSQLSIPFTTNPFALKLKTTPVLLPIDQQKNSLNIHYNHKDPNFLSVVHPSLVFSNTLFFNSAYNVQVIVADNEPEEKLIGRFRREVFRAGVVQECKRRRFFETNQEKRKRKKREAARRNRKRRPPPKGSKHAQEETPKKKDESDDDNWEYSDADLPYC